MTDTSVPQPGSPDAPIALGPGTGEPAVLSPPFDPGVASEGERAPLPTLAEVLARFAPAPPTEEPQAGPTSVSVEEQPLFEPPEPVIVPEEATPVPVSEPPVPDPVLFDETPLFEEPEPAPAWALTKVGEQEAAPAPAPAPPAASVTEEPVTADPLTADPLTADPLTADPLTAEPLTAEQEAVPFDQDFLTPAEGVTIPPPPPSPEDLEPVFLTAPRVDPAAVAQLGELNGRELDRRAVTVNEARIRKLEPGFGFSARVRSFLVLLAVTLVVATAVAAVLAISIELISVWANHAISKSAGS